MYRIFGCIALLIVLLIPYVYFGVKYINMQSEIKTKSEKIINLEAAISILKSSGKEKDEALQKCKGNCNKVAETAAKIDKNHIKNTETKKKIDKALKVIKEQTKVNPNTTCEDTRKYVKLINELYK